MNEGPLTSMFNDNSEGVVLKELRVYRVREGIMYKEVCIRRYQEDGNYHDSTSTTPMITREQLKNGS